MQEISQSNSALKQKWDEVNQRIAEAAERSDRRAEEIAMIAVTKTATPDEIYDLTMLGQRHFGENKVQQMTKRCALLQEQLTRHASVNPQDGISPEQITWHMIGHLQRNKIKQTIQTVKLIHSVDSLRLAEELHEAGSKHERQVDILLQVNASGEESKFGLAIPAAIPLAQQIDTMVHLKLRGLMTMAPYSDNPEDARSCFQRCSELYQEIKSSDIAGGSKGQFNILSMGMSGDFEVAIEEGANVVRIGRAIFGERKEP